MVPSSTSVTSGEATCSPRRPANTEADLGDQVGLEAVTARLVEQHAAAARSDHHRHLAGRRGAGRELGERPLRGGAGQLLDVVASNSSKPTVRPTLSRPVCMPVSPDATRRPRTACAPGRRRRAARRSWRPGSAGGCRRSSPTTCVMAPPADRAASSARASSSTLLAFATSAGLHLGRAGVVDLGRGQRHHPCAAAAIPGRGRRGRGRRREPGRRQVGGVREPGGLADDDPDAGAAVAPGRQLLDPAVVEEGRRRALVLGEDLGEVAPGPQRLGQHGRQGVGVDQVGCGHRASWKRSPPGARRSLVHGGTQTDRSADPGVLAPDRRSGLS